MFIFGIFCPTSRWIHPLLTTPSDLWWLRKILTEDESTVNWQNVRFLSSQTKPHLDYYNMILAITVLISSFGQVAMAYWRAIITGPSWPVMNCWNFFCVFLFKSFYACLSNFDNIFPKNIDRSIDKWKMREKILSKQVIAKLHSFRQFVFLPSRNIAFIIIRRVTKSDFLKNQFFGHSEIYLRLLWFHKMVFCNPQSSRT